MVAVTSQIDRFRGLRGQPGRHDDFYRAAALAGGAGVGSLGQRRRRSRSVDSYYRLIACPTSGPGMPFLRLHTLPTLRLITRPRGEYPWRLGDGGYWFCGRRALHGLGR